MGSESRELKKIVGREAAESVRSGMRIGLGSGSTAEEMVRALGERIRTEQISDLRCVATSERTAAIARDEGMTIEDLDEIDRLDLTIDGADEIDPQLRLIKGLGGALLREKIVAQASDRMIVIADSSKLVQRLGRGVLPVEIVRFGHQQLRRRIERAGLAVELRGGDDPFITDEGHLILDVSVAPGMTIDDVVEAIESIAGVVEHGYFRDEATEALIAEQDGSVTRIVRES